MSGETFRTSFVIFYIFWINVLCFYLNLFVIRRDILCIDMLLFFDVCKTLYCY